MKDTTFPTLKTPYFDDMDKNMPWNEYPRPQMKRESFLCLNGQWDFAISESEDCREFNEKILVPFPVESLLSGIQRDGVGKYLHYRCFIELPENFKGGRIILHFGAVDTICDVYVNGSKVAHNEGGYLPFSADITDFINNERNELYVRVRDDLSIIYPYGKQTKKRGGMWYTPVSGIWQTVWAECVPDGYVEKIKITSAKNSVNIKIVGGIGGKKITLDDGKVYEFDSDEITITPDTIKPWTPEEPNLYYFTLEVGEDKIQSYFALREIGVEQINGVPRITLNGKPYLFNGLLDQGYFPDGIFLPATPKGYEDDIRLAKELGFNMLRKHIKIEPDVFYHLCDKMGMVIFQDMVNNSGYSFICDTALPTIGLKSLNFDYRHLNKKSRAVFEAHMYGTMEHLYSFPSVLYYTIFNEGWGQFCADEMYEKAKKFDSTRIIDATSGWFFKKKSDVDSRHVYFKPVELGKTNGRPIVISEFGGYSHRVSGHLFGMDNYGYSIYEKREDFESAFHTLYRDEIKPLISKGICALVYTQISDVEDETNGLITYDRCVLKVDKDSTYRLMNSLYEEIK